MRSEQTFYGDFKVTDELPFTSKSIMAATVRVARDHGESIYDWPVMQELVNGFWELYFVRPVTDEVYNQLEFV